MSARSCRIGSADRFLAPASTRRFRSSDSTPSVGPRLGPELGRERGGGGELSPSGGPLRTIPRRPCLWGGLVPRERAPVKSTFFRRRRVGKSQLAVLEHLLLGCELDLIRG